MLVETKAELRDMKTAVQLADWLVALMVSLMVCSKAGLLVPLKGKLMVALSELHTASRKAWTSVVQLAVQMVSSKVDNSAVLMDS
jgi:hypothetical protein